MAMSEEWANHTKAIMVAELGQEEYEARLRKQNMIFEKASDKRGALDCVGVWLKTKQLETGFKLRTISTGKRATHGYGIGAQGFARVMNDLDLPENDFFTPNRLFEVRARHSNSPDAERDTMKNIRSLSIKFADHDWESPLDLLCNTGKLNPFFNADSVIDLLTNINKGDEREKAYLLSLPVYLDSQIETLRHMPDSYYHQHYYGQTVYDFKCKDGKLRLAKFRILPADGSSESGKLTEEEQKKIWNREAPSGTTKPDNYLKQEFSDRLKQGHVEYILQIQIHECTEGSAPEHKMYNGASDWPTDDHPWMDLMHITLTTQLPADVMEITRFTIANHPKEVLGFPAPKSHYDFNIISHMRCEVYSSASASRHSEPKDFEDPVLEYDITVFTADRKGAGTDADVLISLIGTKSRTAFRRLDTTLHDDFEAGSSTLYKLKDKDVGDILCIKIYLEPTGKEKNDWYLNYITVATTVGDNEKLSQTFPCYRWLTDKVSLLVVGVGKASLPQNAVHPYIKLQRELEVQELRKMYQWREKGIDPGLEKYPGYIAAGPDASALPRDAQFYNEKAMELDYVRTTAKKNVVLGTIQHKMGHLARKIKGEDAVKERTNLISSVIDRSITMKHILEHWHLDEEFGRQVLQGVNPVKIIRIGELPENFPVTEEMVEGALDEGKTLADELKDGKVYLITYPELLDYATSATTQERYLCAPMCLLYVKGGKSLVPIAIQLTQTPSPETAIFTQKDNKGKYSDWMVAKMWVKEADANYHQMATHLMGTHLIMEPVAIAVMRNLPSMHPIFKIMVPHLRFVMAINTLGRKRLIPHGAGMSMTLAIAEMPGVHIKFMAKMYESFTYDVFDIPKSFEVRGVEDKNLLPGYYYRDDALLLWNAIKGYVSSIVNIYYSTDRDVAADTELTNLTTDLKTNGYHEKFEFPEKFKKKEELVHFVTAIIFCCSCQHAAVNFGQLDYYGFSFNAPTAFMKPPPTAKSPDGMGEEDMKKLLPSHDINQRSIGLANLLSMFSDTEVFLGNYPDKYFTEPEALAAMQQFKASLNEVTAVIKQRNHSLPVPYEYLLPERVPSSIAI